MKRPPISNADLCGILHAPICGTLAFMASAVCKAEEPEWNQEPPGDLVRRGVAFQARRPGQILAHSQEGAQMKVAHGRGAETAAQQPTVVAGPSSAEAEDVHAAAGQPAIAIGSPAGRGAGQAAAVLLSGVPALPSKRPREAAGPQAPAAQQASGLSETPEQTKKRTATTGALHTQPSVTPAEQARDQDQGYAVAFALTVPEVNAQAAGATCRITGISCRYSCSKSALPHGWGGHVVRVPDAEEEVVSETGAGDR
jgi:hypothetical protein